MKLVFKAAIVVGLLAIEALVILGYRGYRSVNSIEITAVDPPHDDTWNVQYYTSDGAVLSSPDKFEISASSGLKRLRASVPGITGQDFVLEVGAQEGWLNIRDVTLNHYYGSRKLRLRTRIFDANDLYAGVDKAAEGIKEVAVQNGELRIHVSPGSTSFLASPRVKLAFSGMIGSASTRSEQIMLALKAALMALSILVGAVFVFYKPLAQAAERTVFRRARRWSALFSATDGILFAVTVISCFVIFQQTDLIYTGSSSTAYLTGHFRDFYEYNTKIFTFVNYLPSTYILFAVWNLPLHLLGILPTSTLSVGYCYLWFKLLTTLFFVATVVLVRKLGNRVGLSDVNARSLSYVYASSPILIFSQFIFGQYDILTVYFVLLGMLLLLEKRMSASAIVFGIAITFKYFAFLVYVPMLLLIEKRPLKILKYLIIMAIPLAMNVLPYIGSAAFRHGVFGFDATDRVFMSSILVFPPEGVALSLFIAGWVAVCGVAYAKGSFSDDRELGTWTIYMGLVVSCLIFGLVFWHPQWVLFLVPFMAMTTFLTKKISYYLLLDFLMMAAFVGLSVTLFPLNVDQQMFVKGPLGSLNPRLLDSTSVFRMKSFFSVTSHPTTLFFSFFAAGLGLNAVLKYPGFNQPTAISVPEGEGSQSYHWYARLRFFGGIMLFVLPAFASYFLTLFA